MRYILAVLLLSVCVSAQNTRTLEQCNADYSAWQSDISMHPLYAKLGLTELRNRFSELVSCEENHPSATGYPNWGRQADWYSGAMAVRAVHFVQRHKLWDQFFDEDEKGER